MTVPPGRLPPYGRYLLCPILLASCGSDVGVLPSRLPANDAAPTEAGGDNAMPSRPEVRTGSPGGAACDASAECLSGACTLGTCSDWAHVMRITVDTTTEGADIREAVTDFPLLVHLDPTVFPMTEARADGADLRFVDATGQSLRHEIETWDNRRGVADLWVRWPRIEANTRDNVVLLYWGNPLAATTADGPSVFGSYANVLHMTADPDGIASHLGDSSGHNNYGITQNPPPGSARPSGIAGPGLLLDGKSTYVNMASRVTSPQPFTFSAWFSTRSPYRGGVAGFVASTASSGLMFDRAIGLDDLGRIFFDLLRGGRRTTVSTLTGYNDGTWHYLVARYSKAGQFLFVDGEPAAEDPTSGAPGNSMGYWRLGEEPGDTGQETVADAGAPVGNFFAGVLDEIRITADQPSDAAIKLTYATQRPATTAVNYHLIP
jgi:hypothetical protein